MYFEYASLCMLWNWLIYLMPIYCCFYVSWFCFTNWKQIKGMKTCCLSNVKQAMDQHFYNSCYSLHLCFAVLALGDNFRKKKKKKNNNVISISLYLLITYYVLLCRIWSDVSWSLLVKWFFFREFPNHDKSKSGHKVIICHPSHHLHIARKAGNLKSIESMYVESSRNADAWFVDCSLTVCE